VKLLIVVLFILTSSLSEQALGQTKDAERMPKSFTSPEGRVVFVDFMTADYEVTYDLMGKKSVVLARIKFQQYEAGLPIFDSQEETLSVSVNGEEVPSGKTRTPEGETTVRFIKKSLPPGVHEAKISVPLNQLVQYTPKGIRSAFWTTDLEDRGFLERYLPANFEFDQVKMKIRVHFKGISQPQKIYTNGVVKKLPFENQTSYEISYPPYFTSSSVFFHTLPEGSTNELSFTLRSVDGRVIPVTVYTNTTQFPGGTNIEVLKNKSTEYFHELEKDYGAWPHEGLIVYNAGLGGMEYCGATMTSLSALGHEMFHSYFARGVMPANGNSGWIDEALASWRDEGYQSISSLMGTSRMSAHPHYTRSTDMNAYTFGERFMQYLEGKLKARGGLKPFMRFYLEKKLFTPFLIENFIQEMSDFYGVSLNSDFKKFTFGEKNSNIMKSNNSKTIHLKLSLKELEKLL
jgi:hypothetical protein